MLSSITWLCFSEVSQRKRDGPPGESDSVHPRQRTATTKQLVFTIRRPGSSIVANPRRPSSVSSVDFPPLEHPEITTKRSQG
jgi:hypothetical protein